MHYLRGMEQICIYQQRNLPNILITKANYNSVYVFYIFNNSFIVNKLLFL